MNLRTGLQLRSSPQNSQNIARPGLVALHGEHELIRLDVQASAVERNSLPDKRDSFCWLAFRPVRQVYESGGIH